MKIKFLAVMATALYCLNANAQTWNTTGNSGTNSAVNFVGNTDQQKLVFRTGNTQRLAISGVSGGNAGIVTIGNLDPDVSPYGGTLQIKGIGGTALDLVRATSSGTGWENQIRFYNVNSMRHLITDDYGTGKLVIQTNVDPGSGSVDILDIRGRVQIGQGGGNPDFITPAGYALYVANGILTERVKVSLKSTGDWADYVFADNYKLRSFSELENFIRDNKHLPGLPSADDMVKQGNDLAKTDAKLLEKIEELTLYVIQLNKEKEALNKQVAELNADKKNNDALFKTLEEQLKNIKSELEKMKK